jgi:hypothetical protein
MLLHGMEDPWGVFDQGSPLTQRNGQQTSPVCLQHLFVNERTHELDLRSWLTISNKPLPLLQENIEALLFAAALDEYLVDSTWSEEHPLRFCVASATGNILVDTQNAVRKQTVGHPDEPSWTSHRASGRGIQSCNSNPMVLYW